MLLWESNEKNNPPGFGHHHSLGRPSGPSPPEKATTKGGGRNPLFFPVGFGALRGRLGPNIDNVRVLGEGYLDLRGTPWRLTPVVHRPSKPLDTASLGRRSSNMTLQQRFQIFLGSRHTAVPGSGFSDILELPRIMPQASVGRFSSGADTNWRAGLSGFAKTLPRR